LDFAFVFSGFTVSNAGLAGFIENEQTLPLGVTALVEKDP